MTENFDLTFFRLQLLSLGLQGPFGPRVRRQPRLQLPAHLGRPLEQHHGRQVHQGSNRSRYVISHWDVENES